MLNGTNIEDKIKEARLRANAFTQSLKEARLQEAVALQALEDERLKWSLSSPQKSFKTDLTCPNTKYFHTDNADNTDNNNNLELTSPNKSIPSLYQPISPSKMNFISDPASPLQAFDKTFLSSPLNSPHLANRSFNYNEDVELKIDNDDVLNITYTLSDDDDDDDEEDRQLKTIENAIDNANSYVRDIDNIYRSNFMVDIETSEGSDNDINSENTFNSNKISNKKILLSNMRSSKIKYTTSNSAVGTLNQNSTGVAFIDSDVIVEEDNDVNELHIIDSNGQDIVSTSLRKVSDLLKSQLDDLQRSYQQLLMKYGNVTEEITIIRKENQILSNSNILLMEEKTTLYNKLKQSQLQINELQNIDKRNLTSTSISHNDSIVTTGVTTGGSNSIELKTDLSNNIDDRINYHSSEKDLSISFNNNNNSNNNSITNQSIELIDDFDNKQLRLSSEIQSSVDKSRQSQEHLSNWIEGFENSLTYSSDDSSFDGDKSQLKGGQIIKNVIDSSNDDGEDDHIIDNTTTTASILLDSNVHNNYKKQKNRKNIVSKSIISSTEDSRISLSDQISQSLNPLSSSISNNNNNKQSISYTTAEAAERVKQKLKDASELIQKNKKNVKLRISRDTIRTSKDSQLSNEKIEKEKIVKKLMKTSKVKQQLSIPLVQSNPSGDHKQKSSSRLNNTNKSNTSSYIVNYSKLPQYDSVTGRQINSKRSIISKPELVKEEPIIIKQNKTYNIPIISKSVEFEDGDNQIESSQEFQSNKITSQSYDSATSGVSGISQLSHSTTGSGRRNNKGVDNSFRTSVTSSLSLGEGNVINIQ
jgi:hypothetical protein